MLKSAHARNNFIYRIHAYTILPGPGSQDAGRFLFLSYFNGFLNLRYEQVPGTNCVARLQVADSRRTYGCVYIYIYIYVYTYVHVYACICTCVRIWMHMNGIAANNQ